ncbi:hypothetical protein ACFLUV_06980 [Elusimicrobiota bacterium]
MQKATVWEYTENWTPSKDTVMFGTHTFRSNFIVGGGPYNREAYVYGGSDSKPQFINRIKNDNDCPGGNNIANLIYNTKWLFKNGYSSDVPDTLAGIDCSGFVSACWDITRTNTTGLANMSIELNSRNELKPGDILDYPDSHAVLILTEPDNGKADIAEAVAPYVQILRNIDLSIYGSSYKPYTAFPLLTDISPSDGEIVNDNTPEIKFIVKSKSSINSSSIDIDIDGISVSASVTSIGTNEYEVSGTPSQNLPDGQRQLSIHVTNSSGFEETAMHELLSPSCGKLDDMPKILSFDFSLLLYHFLHFYS